ncbi:hypothetical protein PR202_ga24248 [Eleusine coracana subsp. coracana]|uniref:DUF6598 domain-containing protein n=1 Tax=Eleusine coracana subsp. coracana TaxID=191504 RepID=A0AAV5D7X5_ELECO|nr:hypothetical protein PR202_ga24248 [Eleusine coracana subsp. coracana]
MQQGLSREKVVLRILHMVLVREFTDDDPKQKRCLPYRYQQFNIAFFDLDKESKVEHGPLYRYRHGFNLRELDESINVISIKVTESDVPYPINIYGTVLARDQYDYRCVYLFKRGRDDPQLISSPDDMLTLTGPYRALAGISSMFFEFNLKIIKGEGRVDQDFSKVELAYIPVISALEAFIGVNVFLDGKFDFMGKISAWTTQTEESKIILYDSEAAGTRTTLGDDGAVFLTRRVVAVPHKEFLFIDVSVYDGNRESICHKFVRSNSFEEYCCKVGPNELEFHITWKQVRKRYPELCKYISGTKVLWE